MSGSVTSFDPSYLPAGKCDRGFDLPAVMRVLAFDICLRGRVDEQRNPTCVMRFPGDPDEFALFR